jgi:hypothetical protein
MKLETSDGRVPKLKKGKYVACDRSKDSAGSWLVANEEYFDTEIELIAALKANPKLSTRMVSATNKSGRANVFSQSALYVDGKPLR